MNEASHREHHGDKANPRHTEGTQVHRNDHNAFPSQINRGCACLAGSTSGGASRGATAGSHRPPACWPPGPLAGAACRCCAARAGWSGHRTPAALPPGILAVWTKAAWGTSGSCMAAGARLQSRSIGKHICKLARWATKVVTGKSKAEMSPTITSGNIRSSAYMRIRKYW